MNHLDAFYKTVHSAPGGCEAIAMRMGMQPQVLRNKANPNSTTNKPTLDDADRLMALTGDYSILHALAQNHGFVLTKLDEPDPSDKNVAECIATIWQRIGEIAAEVNKTLEDNRVERHEVAKVRNATYKALPSFLQLVECLNGMAEK